MAKIITSFDTQSKEFAVTIDDKLIKNVSAVEFYGFGDSNAYCELTTVEMMEDDKMVKVTRLSAEESEPQECDEISNEIFEFAKQYRVYP